jgi:hypothetical protein
MEYNNSASLMDAIHDDVAYATEMVARYVYKVVGDSIIENVYMAYQPEVYKRSNTSESFLGSWVNKRTQDDRTIIRNEIYSDWQKMSYMPEEARHGNIFVDRRGWLDEAIQEGFGYDYMNAFDSFPRDYWNPAIDEIETEDVFDLEFIKALKSRGIKFIAS